MLQQDGQPTLQGTYIHHYTSYFTCTLHTLQSYISLPFHVNKTDLFSLFFDTIPLMSVSWTCCCPQLLVGEVHRRVMVEYLRALMRGRIICTSQKMRKRMAGRLRDEGKHLKMLFKDLVSILLSLGNHTGCISKTGQNRSTKPFSINT